MFCFVFVWCEYCVRVVRVLFVRTRIVFILYSVSVVFYSFIPCVSALSSYCVRNVSVFVDCFGMFVALFCVVFVVYPDRIRIVLVLHCIRILSVLCSMCFRIVRKL